MSEHAGKHVAESEPGVARVGAGNASAAIAAKNEFGLVVDVVPLVERDTCARFRSNAGEATQR